MHRTTSIVCSVVISQGVAVVRGMGYVCAESFMTTGALRARSTSHTREREKKRGGLAKKQRNKLRTIRSGRGVRGMKVTYTAHSYIAVAVHHVCGVCTLFPIVDAHVGSSDSFCIFASRQLQYTLPTFAERAIS